MTVHAFSRKAQRALQARSRALAAFLCLLVGGATQTSCVNVTNVLEPGGSSSRTVSNRNVVNAGTPQVEIGTSGNAAFRLVSVLLTSSDPSNSFDLIGEGDTFGTFCSSSDGNNAAAGAGPSTCVCVYDYITTSGQSEQVRVDTAYREQNLIRCPYSAQLPSNIPSVSVRVYLTNADLYTNSISVRMGTNRTVLSPTDSASFVQPRRYQCRNTVTINYDFDGNLYDPIRSEDPKMARTLNFYTSDMGATLTEWLSSSSGVDHSSWECPSIPNDPAMGMDLTLYSKASDGASEKIYPALGSRFDRSTFFLAKQSTGIFNVRVNARVAPDFLSCAGNTPSAGCASKPLGFGASPVVTSSGEGCPTNAEIPAGFRWVKVWRFKAENLFARRIKTNARAIAQIGAIACNPGKWKITDQLPRRLGIPIESIFPDCGAFGGTPISSDKEILADRIFGTESANFRCVSMNSGVGGSAHNLCLDNGRIGAGCTTSPITGTQRLSSLNLFKEGTDIWTWPRGIGVHTDFNPDVACTASGISDPLGFCSQAGVSGTNGRVPAFVAEETQTLDGGNAQKDDLFVVTPPEVTSDEMSRTNSTSTEAYKPFRFLSSSHCASGSPSSAPAGDCLEEDRIHYNLSTHDITQEESDGSGRTVLFPVCALQPSS